MKPMKEPQSSLDEAANNTDFGYARVPLSDKQSHVDAVFRKVASRYDLMNDLMSGGLHRVWKDIFAAKVQPSKTRAFKHLDVAGGTGDIAFRVARAGTGLTEISVLDINPEMLKIGEERAKHRHSAAKFKFIEANAEELPFPDASFDAYTIAFGIRNVPRINLALSEAYRVLKRGGHFLCLEFSNVTIPGLDRLYEAYSFRAIPLIGEIITKDRDAYRYLVESIRRFPDAESFKEMIEAAQFSQCTFTRLSGGIVAIHSGWKL
jgi:demethylmenaquinone methyltransferase/2-methoxy-6-polyprenyl-1,4-benzoquinol methylase